MTAHDPILRPLRSHRARPLAGTLAVGGDGLIAARALAIAAMAMGQSVIANVPATEGIGALVDALRSLGVRVDIEGGAVSVSGLGAGGLLEPAGALDFSADGAGVPLLLGAVGIAPYVTRLIGPPDRDLGAVFEALAAFGISVLEHDHGRLPVELMGPRLMVSAATRARSADAKAAALLAAVAAPGTTTLTESGTQDDHTENLLAAFGAKIETGEDAEGNRTLAIAGLPDLRARQFAIPGDPAAALYAIAAAMIVPGSDIVLKNVLMAPARAGLLPTLMEMGGDIRILSRAVAGGEDVADIGVRHAPLYGAKVPFERDSTIAEDFPVLALAAAFAEGETVIEGLGIAAAGSPLAALLRGFDAIGTTYEHRADSLIITGRPRITGGAAIASDGHPGIALAFAILGMATRDPIGIDDTSALAARYPGLIAGLTALGGHFKGEAG